MILPDGFSLQRAACRVELAEGTAPLQGAPAGKSRSPEAVTAASSELVAHTTSETNACFEQLKYLNRSEELQILTCSVITGVYF